MNNMFGAMFPVVDVERLLNACFSDESVRVRLARRLVDDIPAVDSDALMQRIQFAIIKLIHQGIDRDVEQSVFDMARSDWRDLLVSAGFAEDLSSHRAWAKSIIRSPQLVKTSVKELLCISIDDKGWVQCPRCNFRFKATDSRVWDGRTHRRCGQPLVLVPADQSNG